ncbi:zinc ABC transporter substrate-binding protein AztC [Nocardia sp. NBC_01329]|uniref:zinc ABC transporter substrate-binding protein AztC n=1 Tax=Nocardia sp. NBC_01329 TaxID=2903594 RepID=UPI002E1273E0|nr:zinc ABC transporter substrate-binding protein AztC [Nocardia sp. NBC_01329]
MNTARRICAALLVAIAPLAGCGVTDSGGGGIVVTTDILGDITRAVVGDAAPVTVLMPPNSDPHSFALSAQEAAVLGDADLIVENGLGLEEGLARHVQTAADSGVATLPVGADIDPLPYRAGDAAGQPDPHFWTDPQRVHRAVEVIRDRVIGTVPGIDPDTVRANADRYLTELDRLQQWMSDEFAAIAPERRKLVTNHHVFGYLAARFDFEVVGAVIPGGTTLASPSAADLADLAAAVRTTGVPAIFVDSDRPDRLTRALTEQAGVQVRIVGLHSEALTAPGAGAATYLEMMRANTTAMVEGLAAA